MQTRKRNILRLLRAAVLLLFATAFLSRCASMMTPTGGPRDTLPPVILNMTPDNFSVNRPTVHHEKIYIEFDEFVQLKDQQKEFFTSPQMKKKPLVSMRGKGIVVQLRDTLEANTTYALNFGSAVRDNNEGNPLYSMRYVFSTGPTIDSMIFSGYTADSYKADSVSKSFIWFFPADSVENVAEYDSTIFKYKPAVIARAENNGIFIAQNLKPIPYRVYAVQDKNDNQMYEPGSDQVGFLEKSYNPAEMPDFAMWYDSDPPICHGRAAALSAHVHRQGVPPPAAFADRTASAAQGDALLRSCASAHRTHPLRQHSRRPRHRRSADRRARHHRLVVQHALFGVARYDQG